LRPVAAARRARDRAGGNGASAGSARLAFAALAAALLLTVAPDAWALGKSPPATPSPPAETPPAATSPAKPAAASSAPSKPVPGAIPAPDIPLEADRLMTTLRALETRVVTGPATVAIETALPSMIQRVSDAQLETKGVQSVASSLTVLTNLADLWSGIQADLKTWAEHLRIKATDVGMVLDELADLTDIWTRTREEARRTQAPPVLL
jgi:hypothetical protein